VACGRAVECGIGSECGRPVECGRAVECGRGAECGRAVECGAEGAVPKGGVGVPHAGVAGQAESRQVTRAVVRGHVCQWCAVPAQGPVLSRTVPDPALYCVQGPVQCSARTCTGWSTVPCRGPCDSTGSCPVPRPCTVRGPRRPVLGGASVQFTANRSWCQPDGVHSKGP